MVDTPKAFARTLSWPDPEKTPVDPKTNPDSNPSTLPEAGSEKPVPTDEKALDRWFLEQRGGKRVPKRLKISNETLVSSGGPLKMTGNITLIHENGNVTHANYLTLCRCGASKNKPFCDDQHLDIEFFDNGAIPQLSDWMSVARPQTITVTCVKNGPLKFRGYLRVYNKKGQECITISGALCRCGKSSKKPFCDNKQGCAGH